MKKEFENNNGCPVSIGITTGVVNMSIIGNVINIAARLMGLSIKSKVSLEHEIPKREKRQRLRNKLFCIKTGNVIVTIYIFGEPLKHWRLIV